MRLYANAKINLGLFVTKRRPDGYHDIESLFVPVDWSDTISIEESNEFKFSSDGIKIPQSKHGNHCIQAFNIIKSKFDIPNVHIHLHKNVPIGAGLGGGSSDAAFVLKGLNKMFDLKIDDEQLALHSNEIGSDCPFFIRNKLAFVHGTGNKFDYNVKANFSGYCVLVYPNLFISTKEAYAGITPNHPEFDLRNISSLSQPDWMNFIKNDFEKSLSLKYPIIEKLKSSLIKRGAFYASLSGSGSTVYGLFNEKPNLGEAFSSFEVKVCALSI